MLGILQKPFKGSVTLKELNKEFTMRGNTPRPNRPVNPNQEGDENGQAPDNQ